MKLSPADYVIEMFGGINATARQLKRSPSTVWEWKHGHGRIPSAVQQDILRKAKVLKLDIKPEDLILGRSIAVKKK